MLALFKIKFISTVVLLFFTAPAFASTSENSLIHHDLHVVLIPHSSMIEVIDKITLPQNFELGQAFAFALHQQMTIDGDVEFDQEAPEHNQFSVPVNYYQIVPEGREITLRYTGPIDHGITSLGRDFSGSVQSSAGMISSQGVFLAGSSAWYPVAEGAYVSFSLRVELPEGWSSVSQGQYSLLDKQDRWQEDHPQQEIYLIAAKFNQYKKPWQGGEAQVFLRQSDEALANRYLDLTDQYIQMYADLIGPYPYAKFALIENFWETGFGMPSFTLLGPKVVRLPFIPYTSYPHEILHNWWGNGVYVDYATGNWAEGLTSYLADHLLKEIRGGGAAYRRAALQAYATYVGEHKDFPLAEFRFRHGASSQAIGYGKGMMLFHMLRKTVGDSVFKQILQQFYQTYRFKSAGFKAWQQVAENVTGRSFKPFFDQWLNRAGAPELRVTDVTVEESGEVWLLRGQLQQTQTGPAYELQVPLFVSHQGATEALPFSVMMKSKQQYFELTLQEKPLRLDVDPHYDLFRQVSSAEIPASLAQVFAADKVLIVLPAKASDEARLSYQRIAQHWERAYPAGGDVVFDEELPQLPSDRAVWLLGKENRWAEQLPELMEKLSIENETMQFQQQSFSAIDHSLVLVVKNPKEAKQGVVWLINQRPNAVMGLLRKLPHYGKYSYLAFAGDAPNNQLKGQWPIVKSPLAVILPGGEKLKPRFSKAPALVE